MKYKITNFTADEYKDISDRYLEWAQKPTPPWVSTEYQKTILDFETKQGVDLNKKIENDYIFAKNYAEKIWVFEKLKDNHSHFIRRN